MRRSTPGSSPLALLTLAVLLAVPLVAPARAHALGWLVPSNADVPPLAIRSHHVSVGVRERIAETTVTQTFFNSTSSTLEATYVFPVPEGATVSGFAMWVNGQRVEGELLDAGTARSVYESIVARMRDPGLVEYIGDDVFRARVYPIAPGAEQRIEIRFTQTLEYQGSVVHYHYPLRAGAAYGSTLEALTIQTDLASRTAIQSVYSPTHPIAVQRDGDHHVIAALGGTHVSLDQDFDLYYTVADEEVGLSLLSHREPGEDGYFLAMISPRTELSEAQVAAEEVLFVMDTSGSMAGDKLQRAQAALDYMLGRLRPTDYFQVVRFSTDVETLFDGGHSVPATPEHVARARRFGAHFVAAGGTAIAPALTEALRTRPPTGALPRMVVFLTDGMPTVGQTDPATITRNVTTLAAGARLFVFGVGDDVNTTFLDGLADANGGVGDYFRDGAELQRRMIAFFDRVSYPVFTDLHLSIEGAEAYDVYPRDLGHLYRGEQLLVVGRYRGDGAARVVLDGRFGGESATRQMAYSVAFPAAEARNDFLPRVWAVRKVGTLLDDIRLHGEQAELRDEVVSLARRFGIVTPYTSFLVTPDEPGMTAPPTPPLLAQPTDPRPTIQPDVVARSEESVVQDFDGFPGAPRTATAPSSAPSRPTAPSSDYGSGTYASSGASTPSYAPPPPPPAIAGRAPTAAPPDATGEAGRRLSARLREMRGADRVDEAETSSVRRALGRTFTRTSGRWVDERFHEGGRVLRIRPMGAAYFAVLTARPELRAAFALGDAVLVTLEGDRAVEIAADAPEVSADEARRFVEGS
ncbi:MAG: VIT and VWA domain-containing protein [Sandaracinus sp.]